MKALEKPAEKNVSKALGELERELARIYGALELVEYVKGLGQTPTSAAPGAWRVC